MRFRLDSSSLKAGPRPRCLLFTTDCNKTRRRRRRRRRREGEREREVLWTLNPAGSPKSCSRVIYLCKENRWKERINENEERQRPHRHLRTGDVCKLVHHHRWLLLLRQHAHFSPLRQICLFSFSRRKWEMSIYRTLSIIGGLHCGDITHLRKDCDSFPRNVWSEAIGTLSLCEKKKKKKNKSKRYRYRPLARSNDSPVRNIDLSPQRGLHQPLVFSLSLYSLLYQHVSWNAVMYPCHVPSFLSLSCGISVETTFSDSLPALWTRPWQTSARPSDLSSSSWEMSRTHTGYSI